MQAVVRHRPRSAEERPRGKGGARPHRPIDGPGAGGGDTGRQQRATGDPGAAVRLGRTIWLHGETVPFGAREETGSGA